MYFTAMVARTMIFSLEHNMVGHGRAWYHNMVGMLGHGRAWSCYQGGPVDTGLLSVATLEGERATCRPGCLGAGHQARHAHTPLDG